MSKSNVSEIVARRLCNTCGGCCGICPSEAIHFDETPGGYYLPIVNEEKCADCGLCRDICPGVKFGPSLLAGLPPDPFSGISRDAYVGHATDDRLYANGQSGGIVSAILIHALELGYIKSAVTVVMEVSRMPRPIVRIARNSQEVLEAQKSKYCPVPLLAFLKELKAKDCPIAVVGTSCQIHGLKNILERLPKFLNLVSLTVGLVCDRVLTFAALDYLVAKSNIDKTADLLMHFRDKSISGYPGDVHVISANGASTVISSQARIAIKDHFTPARCRICFDKMNIFSDLTVGDPHGISCVDRKRGESVIIARTEIGQKMVRLACANNAIEIRSVGYDSVLKGQGIDKKKIQWRGYVEAWTLSGLELPNYVERVKEGTSFCSRRLKYLGDIQTSLSLDRFSSRSELIRYVDRKVRRLCFFRSLIIPLSIVKKAAKKMFQYIFTVLKVR